MLEDYRESLWLLFKKTSKYKMCLSILKDRHSTFQPFWILNLDLKLKPLNLLWNTNSQLMAIVVYELDLVVITNTGVFPTCFGWPFVVLSSAAEIYICLALCECLADYKINSSSFCVSFSYSACSGHKPPSKGLRLLLGLSPLPFSVSCKFHSF